MLRVVDTGRLGARQNLSLTESLCQRHKAGLSPQTLRFQHFHPSAIIGRHQRLEDVVDIGWCRANGVETARRMTGGGAIIMGPGLLGWELVVTRPKGQDLAAITRLICESLATALTSFGINAAFRPRNDIEVDGRKISGTGGYIDGGTLVFQGTVIIALDGAFLTEALKLPAHKLQKRAINTIEARMTDLTSLLGAPPDMASLKAAMARHMGEALGLTPHDAPLSTDEHALADTLHDALIGQESFVEGALEAFAAPGRLLVASHLTPGGLIEVALKLRDGAAGRIACALVSTDLFVTPPRAVNDLEAALHGASLEEAPAIAKAVFARHNAQVLGGAPEDIVSALHKAILSA